MALTDDREYKCQNPDEFLDILAGAADTLYKGAIVSIGGDGFIKVPGDVAGEVPIGVMRKRVVAAGAHAEHCEIDTGRLLVKKVTQHAFTVLCTNDAPGNNANYNNKYFYVFNGKTRYHVWFNVAGGGVDPVAALGTPIVVALLVGDVANDVADKVAAALDASVFTSPNPVAATLTATADLRGYSLPAVDGNCGALITITNTVLSGAHQADLGLLFKSMEDDGVVYTAAAPTADVFLGRCVGFGDGVFAEDYLMIDTRQKANN